MGNIIGAVQQRVRVFFVRGPVLPRRVVQQGNVRAAPQVANQPGRRRGQNLGIDELTTIFTFAGTVVLSVSAITHNLDLTQEERNIMFVIAITAGTVFLCTGIILNHFAAARQRELVLQIVDAVNANTNELGRINGRLDAIEDRMDRNGLVP